MIAGPPAVLLVYERSVSLASRRCVSPPPDLQCSRTTSQAIPKKLGVGVAIAGEIEETLRFGTHPIDPVVPNHAQHAGDLGGPDTARSEPIRTGSCSE